MGTDIKSGLSRRTFLKGGLAAGAGMFIASSGLAGCAGDNADADALGAAAGRSVITHDADVLVVGAGAAGTEAAISAAAAGARVIIVDKKAFGQCGDSGMHFSGRMTTSDFGVDGDNVDVHLQDAVTIGHVIEQKLVAEILQGYLDDKVTLKSENYGNVHFRDPATGQPKIESSINKPRNWPGFKLRGMAYKALEGGAQVLDYCTVTKLLHDKNGAVVGATAVDFRTGNFHVIRAKGTVLATGGDSNLWGAGLLSSKFGGGVEALTGDGHALAAPLGVEYRDLEFRANYPYFGVLYPSGLQNLACLWSLDPSKYEDAKGNTPYAEAMKAGTYGTRMALMEFYKTQLEGRGTPSGGMYAPIMSYITGVGSGSIAVTGYPTDLWDQIHIAYAKQGNDLSKAEVGPQMCYDYGGMVTNAKGETAVEGLYAAGECAMHCGVAYAVLRMFSSALVMGKRAAEAAAARSKSISAVSIDVQQVADEYDRVFGILTSDPKDSITVHALKHRIQDSAWKGAGSLRSEKWCNEALAELDAEEADLKKVALRDKSRTCNIEWMEALALRNMIKMARLDTLAALNRKESRGAHIRAEYPEQDNDNWVKNVYLKEVDGKITVEIRDADTSRFPVPSGKTDLGGGILNV